MALLGCSCSAVVLLGASALVPAGPGPPGAIDTTELILAKVEMAIEMHAHRHGGAYPSTSAGLSELAHFFTQGEVPSDGWGNELAYASPCSHGDHAYEVISWGADGRPGGHGADADIHTWQLDGGQR